MKFSKEEMDLVNEKRGEIINALSNDYKQDHIDQLERKLYEIFDKYFKGEKTGAMILTLDQFQTKVLFEVIKKAGKLGYEFNPTKKGHVILPS